VSPKEGITLAEGKMVAIWTLTGEGEVFGKMVVSRSRKILSEVRILRREKWR
jgi:hypothetical protein